MNRAAIQSLRSRGLALAALVAVAACQSNAPAKEANATPENPAPPPKPTVREAKPRADETEYYAPTQPAVRTLQKAHSALAGFPADRKGRVDWVAALRRGVIEPRADLRGEQQMTVMDLDVVMTDTRAMPYVVFPHKAHTEWLDCRNCHDGIFKPQAGANPISMNEIFKGRYCGVCHDKVAFSVYICERCHSLPQEDHAGKRAAR